MSRVLKPMDIPSGVTVTVNGQNVTVKGSKGAADYEIHPSVEIVQEGEVVRFAVRFVVDDEVDIALAIERHVFRAVPRDGGKAEQLERLLEHFGIGRSKLDELEAVEAHRVLEQVSHVHILRNWHCFPHYAHYLCTTFPK